MIAVRIELGARREATRRGLQRRLDGSCRDQGARAGGARHVSGSRTGDGGPRLRDARLSTALEKRELLPQAIRDRQHHCPQREHHYRREDQRLDAGVRRARRAVERDGERRPDEGSDSRTQYAAELGRLLEAHEFARADATPLVGADLVRRTDVTAASGTHVSEARLCAYGAGKVRGNFVKGPPGFARLL